MSTPRAHQLSKVAKDYVGRLVADDSATTPQLELVIPVTVPDAATGDIDLVVTDKFEVIGMTCIKRNGAGAGNTVTLKKSGTAISDAVACATDNAVTTASTIDDAGSVNVFSIGDTLRLSCTRAAGTRDSLVLVRCILRA
jgi:hypothetical protein